MPDPSARTAMPRIQSGSNSQLLLTTVLAEYTFERTPGLTSAAVVRMLSEFGITESGARSALSRVVARGLLVAEGRGRAVRYAISAASGAAHLDRLAAVVSGTGPQQWDGEWTTVMFSIPAADRALRHRWRSRLEQHGFAPLIDGCWVSPTGDPDALRAEADALHVDVAVARARFLPSGNARLDPRSSFDVAGAAAPYTQFQSAYLPTQAAIASGGVSPSDAFVTRTRMLRDWRAARDGDPRLPVSLLPAEWPAAAARTTFLSLFSALAPQALAHLRALLAPSDPDTAARLDWVRVPLPD